MTKCKIKKILKNRNRVISHAVTLIETTLPQNRNLGIQAFQFYFRTTSDRCKEEKNIVFHWTTIVKESRDKKVSQRTLEDTKMINTSSKWKAVFIDHLEQVSL
jgi:hypothetical protein